MKEYREQTTFGLVCSRQKMLGIILSQITINVWKRERDKNNRTSKGENRWVCAVMGYGKRQEEDFQEFQNNNITFGTW